MENKKMKLLALCGILGGIFVAIGDLLVYMLPNVHNAKGIYDDWAKMSMLRPTLSFYLGCASCIFLLMGFISFYTIIKKEGSKLAIMISRILACGVALTSIGHFLIACIVPMTYKGALVAGASAKMAQDISTFWEPYISPMKLLIMILVIVLQSFFVIVMILKGKINCPKWMIIFNPIVLILISIPISIVLDGTGYEGLVECFESLGEGFMYIAVYWHWKKQGKIQEKHN